MRLIGCFLAHRIHLVMAAAAFVQGALNFFPGLAGALLDAANQFILLALDELHFVIRKLRKSLFQLALGDVPVPFGCEQAHKILRLVMLFLPRDLTRMNFFCNSRADKLQSQLFEQIQSFTA
jgi:hypothetical protein